MVHCPAKDQLADDLNKPKGKKFLIRFFKTMNYKDEDVLESEMTNTTFHINALRRMLKDQIIF